MDDNEQINRQLREIADHLYQWVKEELATQGVPSTMVTNAAGAVMLLIADPVARSILSVKMAVDQITKN